MNGRHTRETGCARGAGRFGGWALLVLLSLLAVQGVRAGVFGTERVDLDSAGIAGNGDGSLPASGAMSEDGRYVAFAAYSSNLVAGDTNAKLDVFVRDRQGGTTERVSLSSGGSEGTGGADGSRSPAMSGDGRYVAFQSDVDNLVPGDTNGLGDVFVRDRQLGTTEIVSVDNSGLQGGVYGGAFAPTMSADGRYVAFPAYALFTGDTLPVEHIYVRDRQLGTTERIDLNNDGVLANEPSLAASISADGRCVAFLSLANNLVGDDTNGTADVFVRDRRSATTERVSVSSGGVEGNGDGSGNSYRLAISADGRYVAFDSDSDNLVAGDTNRRGDVFIRDRQLGTTERADLGAAGSEARFGGQNPSLSANGRYVAFLSFSDDLVEDDTNDLGDIFVRDRVLGVTARVSTADDGSQGTSAFYGPYGTSLSPDGRYVGFVADTNDLVPGDTEYTFDAFVVGNRTYQFNRAPVALPQSAALASNTASTPNGLPLSLGATDADGDVLLFAVVQPPAHGSLSPLSGGDTTYTPDANYVGPDSFTFKVNDGTEDSNTATVSLAVTNRAPTGVADSYTVFTNSQLYVVSAQGARSNDTDPEEQTLQLVLLSNTTHGALCFSPDGWFLYTPQANFAGTDSFTYRAVDSFAAASGETTVLIRVSAPPIALPQSAGVDSNTVSTPTDLPLTLTASDLDGDPLTYSIVSGPAHGTLGPLTGATVTYTPAQNYTGSDSFTFRVTDGTYFSSPAAVSIAVGNRAPTAAPDSYSVRKNSQIYVGGRGILANDTDPESHFLHSALVSGALHGALALSADGWFLYTPAPGYSGADSFTYLAYDAHGGTSAATTVTITVTAP